MTTAATADAPAAVPPHLAELKAALREAKTLGSVQRLLGWDQETYMPRRAAPARAEQAGVMARLVHERTTDPRLGDLLARCAEDPAIAGDGATGAMLREAQRDYDRATRLPAALVTELAEVGSRSQDAWKDARAASDFAAFRPWLEKLLTLKLRQAECYGVPDGGELYDALLEDFEPGARAAEIEAVFTPLRAELTTLVAELLDRGTPPDAGPRAIHAPEAGQHQLGLAVLRQCGFDLAAGRLDTTTHPFCEGLAPGDTRLTTRYREDCFTDALYGTMHEGGHGLYEQGLPKEGDLYGTPLAEAVSLGIHESQSRMWENFVGRSRGFWEWAAPLVREHLGEPARAFDADALYRACNTVERSFIRVEADEATYNLHVMLRFGIERALLRGELAVADLPGVWNERFEEMLGVAVPDDRRGCLQDVHWSFGLFGYFPTYTVGNLYAAQFWRAIEAAHPDLHDRLAEGDFRPVLAWNRAHIHAHGRRYTARELCERATGKPLSAEPLLTHLRGKLSPIYGI